MSPLSCSRLVERRRLQQAPFFFLLPLFSLSIRSSKRLKKKNNATMLVECSANNPTDRLTTFSRFEHNLLFLSSAVISRYILNMHIFFDIFFVSYYKLLITYSFHKNPIFPSIRTIGGSTNLNGETKRRTRRGEKSILFLYLFPPAARQRFVIGRGVTIFLVRFSKVFFFSFLRRGIETGPPNKLFPWKKNKRRGGSKERRFPFRPGRIEGEFS